MHATPCCNEAKRMARHAPCRGRRPAVGAIIGPCITHSITSPRRSARKPWTLPASRSSSTKSPGTHSTPTSGTTPTESAKRSAPSSGCSGASRRSSASSRPTGTCRAGGATRPGLGSTRVGIYAGVAEVDAVPGGRISLARPRFTRCAWAAAVRRRARIQSLPTRSASMIRRRPTYFQRAWRLGATIRQAGPDSEPHTRSASMIGKRPT